MFRFTVTCLLAACLLSLPAAQTNRPADFEVAVEEDLNAALLSGNWKKLQEIEGDDLVFTNADGSVTHKTDDVQSLKTGELRLDSISMSEVQVKDLGLVRVTTGKVMERGRYKGVDFNETYRFTDVWTIRNGKWQLVAGQETKVAPPAQ